MWLECWAKRGLNAALYNGGVWNGDGETSGCARLDDVVRVRAHGRERGRTHRRRHVGRLAYGAARAHLVVHDRALRRARGLDARHGRDRWEGRGGSVCGEVLDVDVRGGSCLFLVDGRTEVRARAGRADGRVRRGFLVERVVDRDVGRKPVRERVERVALGARAALDEGRDRDAALRVRSARAYVSVTVALKQREGETVTHPVEEKPVLRSNVVIPRRFVTEVSALL